MLPLNAITIAASPGSADAGGAPVPAGTFEGRVVQLAGRLAVRVGSVELPLPEGAPFVAGQSVSVTRPAPHGAIEVRPLAVQPQPAGGGSLVETLGRVLAELNVAASRNADALQSLLPVSAPLSTGQVRQLVALFAVRGALGPDLAAIAAHLNVALAAGWRAPEWLRSFLQFAGARAGGEPEAVVEWLQQMYRGTTTSAEGRLAANAPEEALESLHAQLRALKHDPALRQVLEAANRWSTFAAHADSALDRLDGRALQQLHALESSYVFAELPAPFQEDFSSVHLHWFRGGRSGEDESDHVVLDLNVSQLGDLWIALRTGAGYCRCVIRAASEHAVSALNADAGTLESALGNAGYGTARVVVERWDGDRLAAAADLMRGGAGLDASA